MLLALSTCLLFSRITSKYLINQAILIFQEQIIEYDVSIGQNVTLLIWIKKGLDCIKYSLVRMLWQNDMMDRILMINVFHWYDMIVKIIVWYDCQYMIMVSWLDDGKDNIVWVNWLECGRIVTICFWQILMVGRWFHDYVDLIIVSCNRNNILYVMVVYGLYML